MSSYHIIQVQDLNLTKYFFEFILGFNLISSTSSSLIQMKYVSI